MNVQSLSPSSSDAVRSVHKLARLGTILIRIISFVVSLPLRLKRSVLSDVEF